VPILVVPVFGDKKYNAKIIATEIIGLHLTFQEIMKENLLTRLTAIINDSM
jgi:UDP:flavonoid glycosyltransferase YjiC (YdhE family)